MIDTKKRIEELQNEIKVLIPSIDKVANNLNELKTQFVKKTAALEERKLDLVEEK